MGITYVPLAAHSRGWWELCLGRMSRYFNLSSLQPSSQAGPSFGKERAMPKRAGGGGVVSGGGEEALYYGSQLCKLKHPLGNVIPSKA